MCAALARPQFLTTIALNNPGLGRSPMRRLIPAARGIVRFGVGVAVSPLLLLALALRVARLPKPALSLLLTASKVPMFIPAAARMLVATFLDLGEIEEATKLATKLIRFSPRRNGGRRFSRVWSLYLSIIPHWLPYINLQAAHAKSPKIVVITSPRVARNNLELLVQLETEFQAAHHVIDIDAPRPLPVVAESILDGIVTDIAISAISDAHSPDIVIALLADTTDHLAAISALSLGKWANATTICVTLKPELSATSTHVLASNNFLNLSVKQCDAVMPKFDNLGRAEDLSSLIANIRGGSA